MASKHPSKKERREYLREMFRQRERIRELEALLEEYKVNPPQPEPPQVETCRHLFLGFAKEITQAIETLDTIPEPLQKLHDDISSVVEDIHQERKYDARTKSRTQ